MKKILSLILVLFIALLSISAFGEGGTMLTSGGIEYELTPEGYPVMSEPVTVKVFAFCGTPEGAGAWETPNDIAFFKTYNEKTGITFEWDTANSNGWAERAKTLIAGNDLPEVFFKGRFSTAELSKYGVDGLFVNLDDKLETYAPNLFQYLEERDLTKYLRLAGGIWGFPYIYETEGVRISKIFVNTKWLAAVDKEMPTNWDEVYDVLVAFRDNDANGNGDPNDETPAGFNDRSDMVSAFSGEFGLQNRGTANAYIDADPADETGNTLRFWYADEAMKDLLRMGKKYYDEKFVPTTFFDADYYSSIIKSIRANNMLGIHTNYATATGTYVDDYIAMPKAPSDMWGRCSAYLNSYGSMVITKECKIPEAMMSWANYFYTIQGAYDYCLGTLGESYIINDEGHTELTDLILHNPDGLSSEQALLRYSIYSGGYNPALLTDDTFKGGECYWTSLEGSANFKPYLPATIWEKLPLSEEGVDIVATVQGDIDTVIAEYCAAFISGKLDIDAGWDEYITKLNQAGMEDYLWAYQEAYNNVNGL